MSVGGFVKQFGKLFVVLGVLVCLLSLVALVDKRIVLWAGGFSSGIALVVIGHLFLIKHQ